MMPGKDDTNLIRYSLLKHVMERFVDMVLLDNMMHSVVMVEAALRVKRKK